MQASERPRFRQDLVAESIDDGGKRFIDVMDPDSGHMFRFYEAEYSLACAMDGQRDVAGIVRWAQDELGMQPNANEVRAVIDTLGRLGYLDGAARAREAAQPQVKPAAAASQPARHAAQRDPDLEPGIVVPAKPVSVPTADVELGRAGTATVVDDIPHAPTLELGAPGTLQAPRSAAPSAPHGDVALGRPGRGEAKARDVSTDLVADVPIRPDDVKEAVRQSQVMRAVEAPHELQEPKRGEPVRATPPAEGRRPQPVKAEPPRAAARAESPRPEANRPAATADSKPPVATREPKPDTKPRAPVEARPAPSAPRAGLGPQRWLLVGIVVLAGLAIIAWKYVFSTPEQPAQTEKPAAAVAPVKPPEPPPPPPPPPVEVEKLALEQPPPLELKAPAAGPIDTILAQDADVKPDDVVVALSGHKPLETEVAGLSHDLDKRYRPDLERAQHERATAEASGNQSALAAADKKIADRQKALDDKQAKLEAKKAELARYVVRAPAAGKVTPVAKATARVGANDVVAKLVRPPVWTATFKSTSQPVLADSRVFLAVQGSDKRLGCSVVAVDAGGIKIACPQDSASDGTAVTFAGLDTSAPADVSAPGSTGSAGSSAGSSGSAAAGADQGSAGSAAGSTASSSGSAASPPPPPHPASRPHRPPAAPAPAPATDTPTGAAPPASGGEETPPAAPPAPPAPPPAPAQP
jgi:hypothetical protein